MNNEFACGIKASVPLCLGIIPLGISYGLLAVQAGIRTLQAGAMSALVMAGSSQLMAVGMIGHADSISIITAVFFVNLRNVVMSSAVMCRLEKTPLSTKLLCVFALCDETFALFSLSDSRSARWLLGANTMVYLTWVFSSVAGAALGQILPDIVTKSFGIAFYAAFLAMLVRSVSVSRGILPLIVLTGAMNALLQTFIPASWALILSMTSGAALGTYFVREP